MALKLYEKILYYRMHTEKKGLIIMTFTTFKSERELNINELKEVLQLMEIQETNERYENTSIHIDGEFAVIDVEIDEDENVTIE